MVLDCRQRIQVNFKKPKCFFFFFDNFFHACYFFKFENFRYEMEVKLKNDTVLERYHVKNCTFQSCF